MKSKEHNLINYSNTYLKLQRHLLTALFLLFETYILLTLLGEIFQLFYIIYPNSILSLLFINYLIFSAII